MTVQVKLNAKAKYASSDYNPKIGSTYECEGIIISIYDKNNNKHIVIDILDDLNKHKNILSNNKNLVVIRWDNTISNIYAINDLLYKNNGVFVPLINSLNINDKHIFKSIW